MRLICDWPDVVPVNPDTYDSWTHPPFSGYFDGMMSHPVTSSQLTPVQASTFGGVVAGTTRVASLVYCTYHALGTVSVL